LSATGSNLLWYTSATGGTGVATPPVPSTELTGTTSYYVSQTYHCESPRSEIVVIVGSGAPTAGITNLSGTDELTCSIASIDVTASGGGSYSWNGGTAGTFPEDRTFTEPGTYNVIVTAPNACADTASITILQDTVSPIAGITNITGVTELSCTTTAINVTASGGTAYAWDGGTAGINPEERTFTEAGTYTVTVTAANGCTDTESINITQNITPPVAGITNVTGVTELNCTNTAIT
jgi:hypothetical protein